MGKRHPSVKGVEITLDMAAQAVGSKLPQDTKLAIDGRSYTIAEAEQALRDYHDAYRAVHEARAVLEHLLSVRADRHEQAKRFLAALKGALEGVLGYQSPDLAIFGFAPRKARTPLTSEQLTIRAEKARRTRELRHTLGKRQKAKLKAQGDPVITVTPSPLDVTPQSSPRESPRSDGAPAAGDTS